MTEDWNIHPSSPVEPHGAGDAEVPPSPSEYGPPDPPPPRVIELRFTVSQAERIIELARRVVPDYDQVWMEGTVSAPQLSFALGALVALAAGNA